MTEEIEKRIKKEKEGRKDEVERKGEKRKAKRTEGFKKMGKSSSKQVKKGEANEEEEGKG